MDHPRRDFGGRYSINRSILGGLVVHEHDDVSVFECRVPGREGNRHRRELRLAYDLLAHLALPAVHLSVGESARAELERLVSRIIQDWAECGPRCLSRCVCQDDDWYILVD